jgi:hypothetical protein
VTKKIDMKPDALAEMKPGTGLCVLVFSALSWRPMSARPPHSALALKVTFHPLDIFLPRSKLRSTHPARPYIFEDHFS